MSFKEFYFIFVFSIALIILHNMWKVMDARRKVVASRTAVSAETFQKYESVIFFIRDKVAYAMVSIFQIIAVFLPELRA
jgi:hypothetical protein